MGFIRFFPLRPPYGRLSRWAAVVILAGLLWRITRYAVVFPLWGDEAFVAVNFFLRDFGGLLHRLDKSELLQLPHGDINRHERPFSARPGERNRINAGCFKSPFADIDNHAFLFRQWNEIRRADHVIFILAPANQRLHA